MILFHGGYSIVDKPKIIVGRFAKDFGIGFYCTTLKNQAIRWAKRYETPIVSVYEYSLNSNLRQLTFDEMTEEWLDFIIDCRKGKKHEYDIVSGPMANDQIFNYISDLMSGILTREQFWVLAKFKYPTQQTCFCTDVSLNCLNFKQSETYDR